MIDLPKDTNNMEVANMDTDTLDAPALPVVDSAEEDMTILDRCDRDGLSTQAFFKFKKTLDDGLEAVLTLCAHHGRQHEPVAIAQGWDVYDFSHRLNEKPTDPSIDDI